MTSKKSQIFLFDLIFSSVIIIISLGIVFSYFYNPTQNADINEINLELISALTNTKINSLNNIEIRQLFIQNEVRNVDNSVAQQISEFYLRGKEDVAYNLSRYFLEDFVLQQINVNVSLIDHDGSYYQLYHERNLDRDFEDAKVSSMVSRTVFSYYNISTLVGPYEFEVRVWQ